MPITHEDLCVATKAEQPFSRDGWIFELKYDGFRILASHRGKRVSLLSRRGTDFTEQFPEIAADLKELPAVVLDCELVILDPNGVPQFEPLVRRSRLNRKISIDSEHGDQARGSAYRHGDRRHRCDRRCRNVARRGRSRRSFRWIARPL